MNDQDPVGPRPDFTVGAFIPDNDPPEPRGKNKTDLCASYLRHLGDDPDARSSLVEDLRCAASILTGDFDRQGYDEVIKAKVSHRTARKLLEAAASLCDHGRTHGAFCRYCESIVSFASYDTNILARDIE